MLTEKVIFTKQDVPSPSQTSHTSSDDVPPHTPLQSNSYEQSPVSPKLHAVSSSHVKHSISPHPQLQSNSYDQSTVSPKLHAV